MGTIRDRLGGSKLGVLSIAAGSGTGQLLLLLAAPLLARLYSPADFGAFAVLATLAAIVGTVAAGRFELAIPLPQRDRDALALVTLGLVTTLVTALLGTVVVAMVREEAAALFGQPALRSWLWLTPWTAAAMGAVLVLNQFAIRHRRYVAIGRRNLLQSGAMLLTQIGAGVAGLKAGGMALGLGAGYLVGALSLARETRRIRPGEIAARRSTLWRTAVRHRRFPLLMGPSGLLNVIGLQVPILLIAYRYGAEVAGWLGLTQRVLALPAALLGMAVAQVYLAELSRTARSGDGLRIERLFHRASRQLAVIAGVGLVVVTLGAPPVFVWLFGAQWANSGLYAQALAVYAATQLVASPMSQTLVVFGRQGLQLAWDAGRVLLVTGAVCAVAMSDGSPLLAVWAFGISAAASYVAGWLLSLWTVRRHRAQQTLSAIQVSELAPARAE
ncbi:oligosaccharide flippase family protein [Micromonospora sp. NPDC047707]|uniref:lipopolysaccharide biosynthesis protein n=1 Tax=unclassified Micromonospora TaxID=2617518 RepID=UPI0018AFCE7B|nr:oligosaccharide flippase family protein [Micromonospora sp. WMMC415]